MGISSLFRVLVSLVIVFLWVDLNFSLVCNVNNYYLGFIFLGLVAIHSKMSSFHVSFS